MSGASRASRAIEGCRRLSRAIEGYRRRGGLSRSRLCFVEVGAGAIGFSVIEADFEDVTRAGVGVAAEAGVGVAVEAGVGVVIGLVMLRLLALLSIFPVCRRSCLAACLHTITRRSLPSS